MWRTSQVSCKVMDTSRSNSDNEDKNVVTVEASVSFLASQEDAWTTDNTDNTDNTRTQLTGRKTSAPSSSKKKHLQQSSTSVRRRGQVTSVSQSSTSSSPSSSSPCQHSPTVRTRRPTVRRIDSSDALQSNPSQAVDEAGDRRKNKNRKKSKSLIKTVKSQTQPGQATPASSSQFINEDDDDFVDESNKNRNKMKKNQRSSKKVAELHRALKTSRRAPRQTEIPMASFGRVVKDVARAQGFQGRFQSSGLRALQAASELYLEQELEATNIVTIHAKRVTVMPKDFTTMKNIKRILGVKL